MDTLIYEVDGRVARITLNRPERGNGITQRMPVELAECVERANLDPKVHAIALAGNGTGFCGGYDLVASAEGDMSGLGETAPGPPGSPPTTPRTRTGTRSRTTSSSRATCAPS
jgi:enoyl-CoA hydratase/carnithine racemase